MLDLYDRVGRSDIYIEDDGTIYSTAGQPLAYLSDELVYAMNGAFLGWFDDAAIWDRGNCMILFSEHSVGGPIKPVRHVRPVRSVKHVAPVRGVRHVAPVRPVRNLAWSRQSLVGFFGLT